MARLKPSMDALQDNTLFLCLPWNRTVFRHETRSFGKVILLSFHPYKEHPKWSPYVISVMILVRTVPEI
jgi:hypothetical protein